MGKASHLNSGQRRNPMNGKQKIKDIASQQGQLPRPNGRGLE